MLTARRSAREEVRDAAKWFRSARAHRRRMERTRLHLGFGVHQERCRLGLGTCNLANVGRSCAWRWPREGAQGCPHGGCVMVMRKAKQRVVRPAYRGCAAKG